MASPQRTIRDVSPVSCVVWKIESERCVASGGTNAITATTASPPTATSDQREAPGDGRARRAPEQHRRQRDGHADHRPARAGADERDGDGREREGEQHARAARVPARTSRKSRISDTSPIVRPSPITSIEASSE